MVGLTEKVSAFFRENPITTERKVNQYLTEHLPRLAKEYKLATKKDAAQIDGKIKENTESLDDLEDWMESAQDRIEGLKGRVSTLEAGK